MATVADIQAYIRTNKVPKDVGMRMLSKAEDLDEPKQEFHETPITESEKTPGFTDTFLPTSLVKSAAKDPAGTIQSLNPAMNLAKGVASSIINTKSGKANLDQIVSPTLESLPLLNALVPAGKAVGGMLGGDKNAPGALLGTLANFALPFVPKGLKAIDASLGGHLGGMLKGAGEGAMNAQPRGLLSAPIHGAIKGLVKGMDKLEPLSNPMDKLATGTDLQPIAQNPEALDNMLNSLKPNPEPVANPTGNEPRPLTPNMNLSKAQNPTGPIAGVRKGVSMNDMLKNIPEKAPDIQPSKTAPAEIENTIQSIKAPEFDNPAQRALDIAQRRLKVASDPKEIQDLNSRIDKLKGMVDRLKSQKEMEIF